MKYVVAGGSGFVGRSLLPEIQRRGSTALVLTRSSKKTESDVPTHRWDMECNKSLVRVVESADALVNLTGEPVMDKRWSPWQKETIFKSRILSTRALVEAIGKASRKPRVLVSSSAVGYYGYRGNEVVDEASSSGFDFLADTCRKWEEEALKAERWGIRVVIIRIGVVLGRGGGALEKLAAPYRFYMGGPLGTGTQWMSWIHRRDLVRMILWAAETEHIRGVYNGTAPNPCRMRDLSRSLGKALKRPNLFYVPSFMLKLLLGERSLLLLTSQRVQPRRVRDAGFRYEYETLDKAFQNLL